MVKALFETSLIIDEDISKLALYETSLSVPIFISDPFKMFYHDVSLAIVPLHTGLGTKHFIPIYSENKEKGLKNSEKI